MSVAVLSEPPSSVLSGVALQGRYTIQHKSDLLLQEQLNNVRKTQEELEKSLTELQITRSKREVASLHAKVEKLRKQSEYEVLKLQVANKISRELVHTRLELERALAGRGDIPACRKRLSWLEDRMEKVMGKHRTRNHKQNASTPIRVRSELVQVRRETPEDTPSPVPVSSDHRVGLSTSPVQPETTGLIPSTQTPGEPEPVTAQDSTVYRDGGQDGVESTSPAPLTGERASSSDLSAELDGDADSTRLTHSAPAGQISHRDVNKPITDDVIDKVEKESEGRESRSNLISPAQPLAVKSQVTLALEDSIIGDSGPVSGDRDKATEYWQSEHHRFESNDISKALCDADPLSYHQMALAIPGSFLSRSQSDLLALPWRPHRKGSDIQDIHKIALNKLVSRLNQMSDKVYNATMLSVRSNTNTELKPETSFVQSYDTGSRQSPKDDKTPGELPALEPSIPIPRVQKRLGTSGSGRMVFFPHPIPPPAKLPLTRTNHSLEFPRLTSHYCDVVDNNRKPAQRIVDQHNLYEETKFSLYRQPSNETRGGLSVTEMRLRKLLESDGTRTTSNSAKTQTSKSSARLSAKNLSPQELSKWRRRKVKSHFAVATAVAKLRGPNKWTLLKPKGSGMEHSGMKWERVKTLVHINLVSERVEERVDAAKHLGLLRCSDAMVFFALKERVQKDDDRRVQYEAAKSLVLIGCWDDDVLEVILQFLVTGNSDIRSDLINTMGDGKNLQYINKSTVSFPELVKVLSHFCRSSDPDDMIAFDAAVLLGKMCVVDKYARAQLKAALRGDYNTHRKAKALEILIKQMNCTDWEVVEELLELLRISPVWKYRDLATKLLIVLGTAHVCKEETIDKVYDLLERKLWDDPITEVRLSVAKTLTALNMFPRASERVEKRLEDADENCRAQAVISLGTLGMKSEKLIRQLLEMIELDSSEYVRIMIVRTFTTLNWNDKRIVRVLREKERSEGVLASEAKKALTVLLDTSRKSKSTRSL